MACSPLESLPTEILIQITDNLSSGHDVFQLRHASKTLYQILSSHDVVSHALQKHYPLSLEANYSLRERDRQTFDAVVRRSYTQPRRKSPRRISRLTCFPLFCSEADQVLAYQTSSQRCGPGWECTLRDLVDDSEVTIELKHAVGGCYNDAGASYKSAFVRDVWCEMGRGVMIVGGKHNHTGPGKWTNCAEGPYAGKFDLGYHGIHVAPRWCGSKHEHTFVQIYSLQSNTLGELMSYFSFYGATLLTHSSANRFFLASLSSSSLFLLPLPSVPMDQGEFPPLSEICSMDTKQATWRDFPYTTSTTALTVDSLGKVLFVYMDSGMSGFYDRETASVAVVSATDGSTLKKVCLGDSRPLFEYRLERDDSRLWEFRFEKGIKSVWREKSAVCSSSPVVPLPDSSGDEPMPDADESPEEGEEVSVTWLGSYGIYGKRGTRIGIEGLDHKLQFTGDRTPVMIEWRITSFPVISPPSPTATATLQKERVIPTLFFAPSEHTQTPPPPPSPSSPPPPPSCPSAPSSGIMGIESSTASFEEIHQSDEIIRWPVPVSPSICLSSPPTSSHSSAGPSKMIKWGIGTNGFYTTTGRNVAIDESKAVTVFFHRDPGVVGDCGIDCLFPRWKMVAQIDELGPLDNSFFFEGVGWLLARVKNGKRTTGGGGWQIAIARF